MDGLNATSFQVFVSLGTETFLLAAAVEGIASQISLF